VRKILWMAGVSLAVQGALCAQAIPRVEVFGGYSYMRVRGYVAEESLLVPGSGDFAFPSFGSNGWSGSVAVNATHWLAGVADIGGFSTIYNTNIIGGLVAIGMKEHSYLFGPRFSSRYKRWTLYAHALFGEAHAAVAIGGPEIVAPIVITETKFAMAVGSGLDFTVYKQRYPSKGAGQQIDIRLGQAEWFRTNFVGSRQDNIRLTTGVVFRFGHR